MDIIGKRKIWYIISTILILPGIIGLFSWKLNFGIDFAGGTLVEYKFSQDISIDSLKNNLENIGFNYLTITTSGKNTFLIRTDILDDEAQQKFRETISKVGEAEEIRFESVGPTVSNDLKRRAIISVILASIAIIFYIAFSFRKVPRPASSWRFGICAVLALIHDLLFVIGLFAILGHFFNIEIDSLFITALLTIMGFSVHDTIVVFDRIRENLRKHPSDPFEKNVNNSIIQTLNRSLNTSITLILVLASLYFLGGDTLKNFMLALLIGITIGTYSSIFNASPLLVSWQGWYMNRFKNKNAS